MLSPFLERLGDRGTSPPALREAEGAHPVAVPPSGAGSSGRRRRSGTLIEKEETKIERAIVKTAKDEIQQVGSANLTTDGGKR